MSQHATVATDSATPGPADLGAEIRFAASQAAQRERVDARRKRAEAPETTEQKDEARDRRVRKLAGVLAFVLLTLTVLNLTGYGFYRMPEPEAMTAQELDAYLKEWLYFEVSEVDAFSEEHGRLPQGGGELGLEEAGDITYVTLGSDAFRVTVRDLEGSLSYESNWNRRDFFGDWVNEN